MIKNLLTKAIYSVFNIINKGKLTHYYNEARVNNTLAGSRTAELRNYLEKWGFNPVIEENSLMTKKDVIEAVKSVKKEDISSWAYTGGSFGEPLKIPYSKKRDFIRTGTFRHFNEIGGYKLGSAFAIIRAKKKSRIIRFLRNEVIIIPTDVSESKIISDIAALKQNNVETLFGYPTVMYEIAIVLTKKPELKSGLKIKSLISTSEMLEDEKREFVHNAFNCNFIDRYSNEEVGLIAQQEKYRGDYIVNTYGVYVEIVNPDTLMPVNTGEEGKVIVTDTNNDLVPIIRYDTGDMAIAGNYKDGRLVTIKKVLGRTSDKLTDGEGKSVSSLALGPVIYKPLANAGLNIQFQLIQEQEIKYRLKLKISENIFPKQVKDDIVTNLLMKLGPNVELELEYVNDIPPLPSGKRPVYLNLYARNK